MSFHFRPGSQTTLLSSPSPPACHLEAANSNSHWEMFITQCRVRVFELLARLFSSTFRLYLLLSLLLLLLLLCLLLCLNSTLDIYLIILTFGHYWPSLEAANWSQTSPQTEKNIYVFFNELKIWRFLVSIINWLLCYYNYLAVYLSPSLSLYLTLPLLLSAYLTLSGTGSWQRNNLLCASLLNTQIIITIMWT